jgi:hypothetical protein
MSTVVYRRVYDERMFGAALRLPTFKKGRSEAGAMRRGHASIGQDRTSAL